MEPNRKAVAAPAPGFFAVSAHAQAPRNAQIVGVVEAANKIDINYAPLALARSHDKQVREFTQEMVTDHKAVQKSVFAPGAKLHVTPAESGISASLNKQAAETMGHLKTLHAAAFDKAEFRFGPHRAWRCMEDGGEEGRDLHVQLHAAPEYAGGAYRSIGGFATWRLFRCRRFRRTICIRCW
jgi:hypothetical protein